MSRLNEENRRVRDVCTWPACAIPIEQPARGRPRLYCPAHADARRRIQDRDRRRAKQSPHLLGSVCQACTETLEASDGKRTVCTQHKQMLKLKWIYRPQREGQAPPFREKRGWSPLERSMVSVPLDPHDHLRNGLFPVRDCPSCKERMR